MTIDLSQEPCRVIPYLPIHQHGILGDRRSACLVAADGTVDWLCLPDFDSGVVFGALLDWSKGGHWRMGPARLLTGRQSYSPDSMILETRWDLEEGTLLLEDVMLWPEDARAPERAGRRVVLRRLRCERGAVRCYLELKVRRNFAADSGRVSEAPGGFSIAWAGRPLRFVSHPPLPAIGPEVREEILLKAGEQCWTVLEYAGVEEPWTQERVDSEFEEARRYWRDWLGGIRPVGHGDAEIRRTAMVVHLLTYAPEGSVVAAPTTSLPERIGGNWNVDYRLSWVRDASLAVGMLARLGNLRETEQYLQWLVRRVSRLGRPLQVLYGLRGEKRPAQSKVPEVKGYRDSAPVRVGNHAYKQHQLGSYGYLLDCLWIYQQEGGKWREEYWALVYRLAKYTVKHWQDPENGIWELPERRHYVASKVLSWVTLERAIQIAHRYQPSFDSTQWQQCADQIHAEVMQKGWSERLQAFRQHYDEDSLDASGLLISVFDFLPGDHPRVLSTLERTEQRLGMDGFIFRFDPARTAGLGDFPLGQMEGAFWPSTFWMATACIKAGMPTKAQAHLARAEQVVGELGLFSEAIDPRDRTLLGNSPLLFSHIEYVRAKLELARVHGQVSATSNPVPSSAEVS